VVYPNPVRPGDPIRVAFMLTEVTESVRVTVVTVAYRKVFEQAFTLAGKRGPVVLTLDTESWKPANGLYYVVVRLDSGKTMTGRCVVLR
jgi:hypothetical protein